MSDIDLPGNGQFEGHIYQGIHSVCRADTQNTQPLSPPVSLIVVARFPCVLGMAKETYLLPSRLESGQMHLPEV